MGLDKTWWENQVQIQEKPLEKSEAGPAGVTHGKTGSLDGSTAIDRSYPMGLNTFNLETWSYLNWRCALISNKM